MKTKKTKVKTFVLTAISISAIALATVTGAVNFGLMADAATGSDASAAEYGEKLANQTPASLNLKGNISGTTLGSGWHWLDSETDKYFGTVGSRQFVVTNESTYDTVTVDVQPRSIIPTIQFGTVTGKEEANYVSDGFSNITTFDPNGGNGGSTVLTVIGQSVKFPKTTPTRSGYTFKGWYTAASGGDKVTEATQKSTNTTYYAQWEGNFKEDGTLPNVGEVSIMTMQQAFTALANSTNNNSDSVHYDSDSPGYSTSTYYMYAINDTAGSNDAISVSTKDNLETVGLDWYKKLNKPTTADNHWTVGNHKVFGGPLHNVYYSGSGYNFYWYYSESNIYGSHYSSYWGNSVSGSVCVAVVHK